MVRIEQVRGGSGADTLIGSEGNDLLRGGAGNDTIVGGNGTEDILDLSTATRNVYVNLATGIANDGLGGTDNFTGIEVLYASTGADTLIGGSGNDIFDGGMNGDLIDGGAGQDRVRYYNVAGNNSAVTGGVSVNLAAERATDGWGGADTLIGIERVSATNFADTLLGSIVSNRFNGLAGN
ncbi:MAG: calcium-binding protein, partial [Acetobacteraceae bacterium]|nr:calcium-binding protein [Acetobacteraceae bacterium]